jgi:rSAM/selenodomain-associated transferase 1
MAHNRTPVPDQAVGDVLIIFTRVPVPGEVKTRLAKQTGAVAAAEHHRAYTEWVLRRTASPAPGVWRRWIAFTPATGLKAVRTWLRPFPIDHFLPQAPGDLGVRLMAATGAAFHAKASRVIVIGTDCLDVDQDVIAEAFEGLDDHDVALGPAHDGGYYLLGLRQLCPKIFQRIPWGTDQVAAATRARARELDLTLFEMPARHDIDRPSDLVHLPAGFLEAHPELAPAPSKSA